MKGGCNFGVQDFRLANQLARRGQRERSRSRKEQRSDRACAEAERAEDTVRGVLRLFVRAATATAVVVGRWLGSSVGNGFVRTSVVVIRHGLRHGIGHCGWNRQHPPEYFRMTGKQRRCQRRRHCAEQHRGNRDPGDASAALRHGTQWLCFGAPVTSRTSTLSSTVSRVLSAISKVSLSGTCSPALSCCFSSCIMR